MHPGDFNISINVVHKDIRPRWVRSSATKLPAIFHPFEILSIGDDDTIQKKIPT